MWQIKINIRHHRCLIKQSPSYQYLIEVKYIQAREWCQVANARKLSRQKNLPPETASMQHRFLLLWLRNFQIPLCIDTKHSKVLQSFLEVVKNNTLLSQYHGQDFLLLTRCSSESFKVQCVIRSSKNFTYFLKYPRFDIIYLYVLFICAGVISDYSDPTRNTYSCYSLASNKGSNPFQLQH